MTTLLACTISVPVVGTVHFKYELVRTDDRTVHKPWVTIQWRAQDTGLWKDIPAQQSTDLYPVVIPPAEVSGTWQMTCPALSDMTVKWQLRKRMKAKTWLACAGTSILSGDGRAHAVDTLHHVKSINFHFNDQYECTSCTVRCKTKPGPDIPVVTSPVILSHANLHSISRCAQNYRPSVGNMLKFIMA